MGGRKLPSFFTDCVMPNDEALRRCVKSGMTVASGFATSEPHTYYASLWDHIVREDIVGLDIRQALFMAPHRICLGSALESKGIMKEVSERWADVPILGQFSRQVHATSRKLEGLNRLISHYEELKRRRITFTSPFIGAATNAIIPANAITSRLYPEYVGRNTTRTGITRMQSIHFPDAVDSMGYDPDDQPMVDTFVLPMTPPNEKGEMSHGLANGANGEILDKILRLKTVNILLYINPDYPFTRGYGDDARNTVNIKEFEGLARAGRLFVVEDSGKLPGLPRDALANPAPAEEKIAQNVVNHIEANLRFTGGRAIQVGFGSTGVLAIKALKQSSWTGRCYTEMLEPFTLDLWEAGKIAGTHFIEKDGRRTQLDGKLACTFTICEEGSDFYRKLHNNPSVIVAPASRVVIPEGFHRGLGINNCLGIDFHGHINAGGRDKNHFSGVGGGATINRGLSNGGIAYFCLKSTHTTPEGKVRSSIFPFLPLGTPVSYIGPDLMGGRDGARFFLVTEHGVTQMSGRDQHNFIKGLISVADPAFRDELRYQAYREFRVHV
jgi:acyl-CoA hydrolase